MYLIWGGSHNLLATALPYVMFRFVLSRRVVGGAVRYGSEHQPCDFPRDISNFPTNRQCHLCLLWIPTWHLNLSGAGLKNPREVRVQLPNIFRNPSPNLQWYKNMWISRIVKRTCKSLGSLSGAASQDRAMWFSSCSHRRGSIRCAASRAKQNRTTPLHSTNVEGGCRQTIL